MTGGAFTSPPAVVVLNAHGAALGRRVVALVPGARLHAPVGRIEDADEVFAEIAPHLRALFTAGVPVIGLCAAGILVRSLAPVLGDKRSEPPVLAVAADAGAVVPLLGGHHGANALARAIAHGLGGAAALTTAGDTVLGLALDEPPEGWRVANPEAAKGLTAALLSGGPVALVRDAGGADAWPEDAGRFLPAHAETPHRLRVSALALTPESGELLVHPPVLAVGVGCERGCAPEDLEALARKVLAEHGLAAGAVACVCSLDLKADEEAVLALARRLDVPARFFPASRLEAETPRLAHPSETVFAEVGCHGVAEGAALAAAGPESVLIAPKRKSRRATCAVAMSPVPIRVRDVGRGRGELAVVGIGPGRASWRTPEASAAIAQSTDLVGYGLYLDLLGPVGEGKRRHMSELGEETERARRALDLAAEGRRVALVCSGDAGIYALAALVWELVEREDNPAWRRIAVEVVPGVSALQAAAARAGAPLGHDFCAISLSDLLTPWETIERRVKAAAEGDFVVAFYNPVSKRRRAHLARARDILLDARPPGTPVILARNLGRAEERLDIIPLAELTPDHADMLTLVMVGSSQSRVVERQGRRYVYTPRGYGSKIEQPPSSEDDADRTRRHG